MLGLREGGGAGEGVPWDGRNKKRNRMEARKERV